MATLSMLARAPIALSSSSSQKISGSLLRSAKIVLLAVPRSKKVAKTPAPGRRLFSQFRGTKLDCVDSVARELKRGKSSWTRGVHGVAIAYTGDESLQKSEDLDSLKASQIKKVRAASWS